MVYEGGDDNDIEVGTKIPLEGNGDFRNAECIELLKEADIVVTNLPFSIAREDYIPQLFEYNKKFLIVGDLNWLTYRDIFPLLQNNNMWLGYNLVKEFVQPDGTIKKFGNKLWFTNLDIKKRHEKIILWKEYNSDEYPTYYNYDGINVDKVDKIPKDYNGVMGVPITFMDKYNPEQFEIVGLSHGNWGQTLGVSANLSDDDCKALLHENKAFRRGFVCYRDTSNALIVPYMRILIRKKAGI